MSVELRLIDSPVSESAESPTLDARAADPGEVVAGVMAARWSPRAFADRSVAPALIRHVLEAARWAPSSSNQQPWRYVVARREEPEAFADLLACLVEANRRWARHAPVLMLGYAATTNPTHGKTNAYARHDLGAASALLSVQAAAMGLQVHQMGGIVQAEAGARIQAPDGFEFVTALALGYPGVPGDLPDDLAARERAPRMRQSLDAFVFSSVWGEPAPFLGKEVSAG